MVQKTVKEYRRLQKTIRTVNDETEVDTVPCRKTRFFPAHFTKLPVAPMISKIHKQYVPHLKDLKLSFKLRYQTFQKSSRLKCFRLNFKS